MPLLPHAKKALRTSLRKAQYNAVRRSKMRHAIKKFRRTLSEDDLKDVFSAVDRALKQHLIHINKAARLKSRLSHLLVKSDRPVSSPSHTAKSTKNKSKLVSTKKKKVAKKVTKKSVKPKKAAAKKVKKSPRKPVKAVRKTVKQPQ